MTIAIPAAIATCRVDPVSKGAKPSLRREYPNVKTPEPN